MTSRESLLIIEFATKVSDNQAISVLANIDGTMRVTVKVPAAELAIEDFKVDFKRHDLVSWPLDRYEKIGRILELSRRPAARREHDREALAAYHGRRLTQMLDELEKGRDGVLDMMLK